MIRCAPTLIAWRAPGAQHAGIRTDGHQVETALHELRRPRRIAGIDGDRLARLAGACLCMVERVLDLLPPADRPGARPTGRWRDRRGR